MRSKELEVQYHMTLLEKQRRDHQMESSKSDQLTRQVSTFSQTETELRSQLNIYVEKFKQVCSPDLDCPANKSKVEDTLNSSNDLFLTFRKEMEEMSKKTRRLEKDNSSLSKKNEAMSQNILQMAEERNQQQYNMEALLKKNENLERLCRGMQAQGRGQMSSRKGKEEDDDDEDSESEYDSNEDDEDDSDEEESEGSEDEESDEAPDPPKTTVSKAQNSKPTPKAPTGGGKAPQAEKVPAKTNGVSHKKGRK
jgi:hypothetical protein